MMGRFATVLVGSVMVALSSLGWTYQADASSQVVTVTCNGALVAPDFGCCYAGESLLIWNGCNQTISVALNDGLYRDIPPGSNYSFPCTNAVDRYYVGIPGDPRSASGVEICGGVSGPMMAGPGLVLASLLLLGVGARSIGRRWSAQ